MTTIEIRHFPALTLKSLFGATIERAENWVLYDAIIGDRVSDRFESLAEAEAAAPVFAEMTFSRI